MHSNRGAPDLIIVPICRTCLSITTSNELIKLSLIHESETGLQLQDLLMACASIQIRENDGLPDAICFKCSVLAKGAYQFKQLCENSDKTLRANLNQLSVVVENEKCAPDPNTDATIFTESATELSDESINYENVNNNRKKPLKKSQTNRLLKYNSDKSNIKFDQLQSHRNEVNSEVRYKCTECEKQFASKRNFVLHQQTHKTDKLFTCKICQKSYAQSSGLSQHSRSHQEKRYLCWTCGRTFKWNSHFTLHLRTHNGVRPYACKICKRTFLQGGDLRLHARIHSGEKCYTCTVCGRGFNSSGSLSKHTRTHTGHKPHECTVCKRKFTEAYSVVKHMRIHLGVKPYQCTLCSKAFTQSNSLKKHMNVHEKEMCNQILE